MSGLVYRPGIDGLRAVSVVAVVLYHAAPALLPGGFVGVDVFFVISGYLITSLLAAEWSKNGRVDFMAFYARRIRRLLPAQMAVVLAVMLAAVVLLGRHGEVFTQTGESAAAALLFAANFYFQFNSGGYFNGPVEGMPLLHLWSLSVEEQFYLVYPALLVLLFRYAAGGVRRRLAVLALFSMLLAEYWVHIYPERAFYQMPARFWELAVGALVALSPIPEPVGQRDRWWLPAGMLLVLCSVFFSSRWGPFPGTGALPAVVGAALVLMGIHRGQEVGPIGALLKSKPFVAVGLLSYSFYLWHWPLLAIDYNLRFDPAPLWWRLALCMVALGLAWVSWRWIERPFRRSAALPPARVVTAGLAASFVAVVAVTALGTLDQIPSEARRTAEFALTDRATFGAACHYDVSAEPEDIAAPECRTIPDKPATIGLIGDSHANAWRAFVAVLADASDESAAGATMNGCPPNGGLQDAGRDGRSRPCNLMAERTLQWLANGEVETVVIATRWPLGDSTNGYVAAGTQQRLNGIEAALLRLDRVPRVIVMGPLPRLKHSAPSCITTGRERKCAYSRKEHELATEEAWRGLLSLAARHPQVVLVDPTDFFCDELLCPVSRWGYALFVDRDHITATASRSFGERYLDDPARYTRAGQSIHPTVPVQP